ncbi:hypothetical protein MPLB_1680107 [Mesorhizobium sp. ORS 3324]|nr:hypothetical protein MPLB_1680107 [Mesorhizobium sp. ORS 3324]
MLPPLIKELKVIVFSAGPHLALSDISDDRISVYSETLEFNSCSIARNSTRNSALEFMAAPCLANRQSWREKARCREEVATGPIRKRH